MRAQHLLLSALLCACSTDHEITRPDGSKEYVITCGQFTNWDFCYQKAKRLCNDGYITLSEGGGFNRKKMRITCPWSTASKQP